MIRKTSEIRLNAGGDLSRFPLAVFFGQPFHRIAVMLRIVATILAMTKRNDVIGRRASASVVIQRYPMVLGEGMPKARRTPADGATITEIFKGVLPFNISQRIWQITFPGAASAIRYTGYYKPSAMMLLAILAVVLAYMITISALPVFAPFGVFRMEAARAFKSALPIAFDGAPAASALSFAFTVALSVCQPFKFRYFAFGNAATRGHTALPALGMQSRSLPFVLIEILKRGWQKTPTFCAVFHAGWGNVFSGRARPSLINILAINTIFAQTIRSAVTFIEFAGRKYTLAFAAKLGWGRIVHSIASSIGGTHPPAVRSSAGTSTLYHSLASATLFVDNVLQDFGIKSRQQSSYVYDDPVDFLEHEFYIPETRQPITLTEHQKRVIRMAFEEQNGEFVYKTILYSSIKKSAKTAIAAGLALWHAWRIDYARIYIVGNDLKQANSRAAEAIRLCIELHPVWHEIIKIKPSGYLVILPNGSKIEAIPVDPGGEAGMNPSAVIWTEAWAVKHDAALKLWTETTRSPTQHALSFRLVESYAGYAAESPLLEQLYDIGVKQGIRLDPEIEVYANSQASMFTYWNTTYHLPWQTSDYYQEQAAILTPKEFQRVHRNQWVTSENVFVPGEWWDACLDDIPPLADKEPLVVALDAAVSGDCFGIVAVSRSGDKVYKRYERAWTPPRNGKIEYSNAHDPDDTAYPEGEIRRLAREHNVVEFAYDPYQLHDLATRLTHLGIGWFRPFPQGQDRIIADKQLYDDIRDRRFVHDGGATLGEHVKNANAKTEGEKLRIVKRAEHLKIDCAVCASMANSEARRLRLG